MHSKRVRNPKSWQGPIAFERLGQKKGVGEGKGGKKVSNGRSTEIALHFFCNGTEDNLLRS